MGLAASLRARVGAVDPHAADVLLAFVLAIVGLVGLATSGPVPDDSRSDVTGVAYVLGLLLTLPVALRRRFPLIVLVTVLVAAVAYQALHLPATTLSVFGVLIAFYSALVYGDHDRSVVALVLMGVFVVLIVLLEPAATRSWIGDTFSHLFIGGATWTLAYNVCTRRAQAAELQGRAEELRARTVELEAAREELAQRAVAEERLRLARELHDVVANSVSIIAVQSGLGHHVIDTQPETARQALAIVESTSRTALKELRRLLGVLRSDGESRGSLSPAPGLENLDELVERLAHAGIAVEVRVEGSRRPLPPAVDLSAYRIVQEALTNVVKHADASTARVTIRHRPREVAVEITDDGRGAETRPTDGRPAGASAEITSGGQGIVGMRERVAAFGGELQAGPIPGGGFAVAARLPFSEPAP